MTGADFSRLVFMEAAIAVCEIAFDVVQYPPTTPFWAWPPPRARHE